jgi:hypothetical protein
MSPRIKDRSHEASRHRVRDPQQERRAASAHSRRHVRRRRCLSPGGAVAGARRAAHRRRSPPRCTVWPRATCASSPIRPAAPSKSSCRTGSLPATRAPRRAAARAASRSRAVSASLRVIDAFHRSGRDTLRVLGASGQLGYGVPTPAFQAGLAREPARRWRSPAATSRRPDCSPSLPPSLRARRRADRDPVRGGGAQCRGRTGCAKGRRASSRLYFSAMDVGLGIRGYERTDLPVRLSRDRVSWGTRRRKTPLRTLDS